VPHIVVFPTSLMHLELLNKEPGLGRYHVAEQFEPMADGRFRLWMRLPDTPGDRPEQGFERDSSAYSESRKALRLSALAYGHKDNLPITVLTLAHDLVCHTRSHYQRLLHLGLFYREGRPCFGMAWNDSFPLLQTVEYMSRDTLLSRVGKFLPGEWTLRGSL